MGTVYLIHFDEPIGSDNPRGKAQHYLGCSERPVEERLQEHRRGNSDAARIMQVVKALGISWRLARTWEGDRATENNLKHRHNNRKLCPICMTQEERGIEG